MKLKKYFIIIALIILVSFPLKSMAGWGIMDLVDNVAGNAGWQTLEEGDEADVALAIAIGTFIFSFLTLVGIIFMVLLIYGGYTWMTAQGNQEKVDKARKIITDAILGIIVILLAGAITGFILYRI